MQDTKQKPLREALEDAGAYLRHQQSLVPLSCRDSTHWDTVARALALVEAAEKLVACWKVQYWSKESGKAMLDLIKLLEG